MKKLLLVLAIGAFVACNNGGGETDKNDTTTVTVVDTPSTPVVDTLRVDTNRVDTPAVK